MTNAMKMTSTSVAGPLLGILILATFCLADEKMDLVIELEFKAIEALYRGEIEHSLELMHEVSRASQDASISGDSWNLRNHNLWTRDIEKVVRLPEESRKKVSTALRLADTDRKAWDAANLHQSLSELEQGYAILAEHLPKNSIIRIDVAVRRFRYLRNMGPSRVDKPSIDGYYTTCKSHYGKEFCLVIDLEMEIALADLVGDDPHGGYEKMQHLLFSNDARVRDSHQSSRIIYMKEFISALSMSGHHQWLQAHSKDVLRFYSHYIHDKTAWRRFILSAKSCILSFERSEDWLPVSEISRFLLAHELIQAPEFRDDRLFFLEYRAEALRKLGEHDEADQIAGEISRVKLQDPQRRSRYTED